MTREEAHNNKAVYQFRQMIMTPKATHQALMKAFKTRSKAQPT